MNLVLLLHYFLTIFYCVINFKGWFIYSKREISIPLLLLLFLPDPTISSSIPHRYTRMDGSLIFCSSFFLFFSFPRFNILNILSRFFCSFFCCARIFLSLLVLHFIGWMDGSLGWLGCIWLWHIFLHTFLLLFFFCFFYFTNRTHFSCDVILGIGDCE